MEHCLEVVARRYPQILLPVKEGTHESDEYRNVCLRGEKCDRPIAFSMHPQDSLETITTPVGDVEVLTLYNRDDFVHACQCLGHKCEPVAIPDSTGAMALFGLNNWDKVRAGLDDYKDSFILLSSGKYSNVSCKQISHMKIDEKEWIEKSIVIRKYHELTHFVMRKKYPDNIDFIRDELIADCIGIIAAFGYFDIDLIKLFLGIEAKTYREGGRLQNYEGGNIENIPDIIKAIDSLKNKVSPYENSSIETIWNNILALM